jgi:DNA polymerase-3 subunit delta'
MNGDIPEPDRIAGAPHPRETDLLFGQSAAEASFFEAYTSGRLHSGWLVTGPRGVGKATLAWKIATFLLSEPPQDDGLFGAPSPPTSLHVDPDHPDARLVQSGAHLLIRCAASKASFICLPPMGAAALSSWTLQMN